MGGWSVLLSPHFFCKKTRKTLSLNVVYNRQNSYICRVDEG